MSNTNNDSNSNKQNELVDLQKRVASASPQVQLTLSAEDIQNLIVAAIRAAKEPTQEERVKLEAEAAAKEEQRKQWQAEAETWRIEKEREQNICGHKKPRGEDCVIGKLFSDGIYRIMCLRCQKIMTEVVATPDMIAAVMQADSLGAISWENFSKMADVNTNPPQVQVQAQA